MSSIAERYANYVHRPVLDTDTETPTVAATRPNKAANVIHLPQDKEPVKQHTMRYKKNTDHIAVAIPQTRRINPISFFMVLVFITMVGYFASSVSAMKDKDIILVSNVIENPQGITGEGVHVGNINLPVGSFEDQIVQTGHFYPASGTRDHNIK